MAISLPVTITGSAQTGFTSPTYATSVDTAPDINAKQVVVTGLGGTQVGVSIHSVASPFTLAAWRPKVLRTIGTPNPTTGVVSNVPNNTYKVITRKGAVPLVGQAPRTIVIDSSISVPAGVDTTSPAELRAAISAHIGLLSNISAGLGDTAQNGVL